MIDYRAITEGLRDKDIFQLLVDLGAEPIDKGDFFVCKTICHNHNLEEASHKLYYYKNTHLFMCYSECSTMSIFKMLKNYYDARNIEYDWFQDVLNVILSCTVSQNLEMSGKNIYESIRGKYLQKKNRKELPTYPEKVLDVFIKKYPMEWLYDGIAKESMDKYNIRFSISQNKIIIPHYDVFGRLIGVRGRALNEWEIENVGKYMPVQIEQKWYSHPLSLNLFGFNHTHKNIEKFKTAYVFESEKAVLQCENFSFPNCSVAVCGNQFNKFQLDLLVRYSHPLEIVICFDKEEKDKEDKYFNKIYNMCKKYNNYSKISFCYDRENLLELKESPSDRGEEVFKKLLNGRVNVS